MDPGRRVSPYGPREAVYHSQDHGRRYTTLMTMGGGYTQYGPWERVYPVWTRVYMQGTHHGVYLPTHHGVYLPTLAIPTIMLYPAWLRAHGAAAPGV